MTDHHSSSSSSAHDDHDDDYHQMDTLAQIKMEIKSMNEKARYIRNHSNEYGGSSSSMVNDWVSYVDEKHKGVQ